MIQFKHVIHVETWLRRLGLFALIGVLCATSACRDAPDEALPSRAEHSPVTLDETFAYLRACRDDRAYQAMQPYIVPESRNQVVILLQAVDTLLIANQSALQAMKQSCPTIEPREFDMAFVADHLGIFSPRVSLIVSIAKGEKGTVTIQINDHLPLLDKEFRKTDHGWAYVPGDDGEDIAPAILEIADALNRMARRWMRSPATPREIRNAYQTRIMPVLQQIASQAESSPAP